MDAGRLLVGLLKISQPEPRPCARRSGRGRGRKRTVIETKTRGEWICLKRIEADLSRETLAQKLWVGELTIRAWENDESRPSDAQWRQLKDVLAEAG